MNARNENINLTESHDWAHDKYQSHTLWLRRALFGMLVLSVLLLLSLMANLLLLPLKEKVPYLYAFDHATGEVTKIGALEQTTFSPTWELSRYLLMQYVIQRESYHADNIEVPYQMVWAQSNDSVRKTYEDEASSSNDRSPYHQYGKDKYITVKVRSINQLNENTVDIKFEKILHDKNTSSAQVIHKEAILKWEFSKAETTQKMLDRDPLGFKVTYYQTTQVNLNKEELR